MEGEGCQRVHCCWNCRRVLVVPPCNRPEKGLELMQNLVVVPTGGAGIRRRNMSRCRPSMLSSEPATVSSLAMRMDVHTTHGYCTVLWSDALATAARRIGLAWRLL
jgi:hypothetical protein